MKSRIYTHEQQRDFPLLPVTVGHDRLQQPRHRPAGLLYHQVFAVTGGKGVLEIGSGQFPLAQGDLFFLMANQPHAYRGVTEDFSTSWICFHGRGVDALLTHYGVRASALYEGQSKGKFFGAVEALYRKLDGGGSVPPLLSEAYAAVVTFFEEAFAAPLSPLEAAKAYIQQNFARPLTLDDVLAVVPFGKSKLCRDFKKAYGETVFEMLMRFRLEHARECLIADPAMGVAQVARCCGFLDAGYFCRMYRRKFGTSPKGNTAF